LACFNIFLRRFREAGAFVARGIFFSWVINMEETGADRPEKAFPPVRTFSPP